METNVSIKFIPCPSKTFPNSTGLTMVFHCTRPWIHPTHVLRSQTANLNKKKFSDPNSRYKICCFYIFIKNERLLPGWLCFQNVCHNLIQNFLIYLSTGSNDDFRTKKNNNNVKIKNIKETHLGLYIYT